MKIIAGIQARMESTRFPGKVLADLCGEPVLGHVINQAKQLKVDDVFLLTADTEENKQLISLANEKGIKFNYYCYQNLQCLYWYFSLALKTKADYVIRICGDSPFFDIDLANILIEQIEPEYDYFGYTVNGTPAIMTLYGIFVEIMSVEKLKAMFEHVTMPFYTKFNLHLNPWIMPHDYKLSIDTIEDLERAQTVVALNGGEIPGHRRINEIMLERPELQFYGDITQKYKWSK